LTYSFRLIAEFTRIGKIQRGGVAELGMYPWRCGLQCRQELTNGENIPVSNR